MLNGSLGPDLEVAAMANISVAVPPNMALHRTCRIVTRFACANRAPTRQAAELGC